MTIKTLAMILWVSPLCAQFAYVANFGDDNVSGYTINTATGALTPIAGSPYPAGSGPGSVTVDPTGKFAYVANFGSNNVSGYTINSGTGVLTAMAGSPFAAGQGPRSVTVDPTGKFAYVANQNSNDVSGYTINSATGRLTAMAGSPFGAGTNPQSVKVDPTGKFAYVANQNSNDVSGYTINSATGVLTAMAGSPFAAGPGPRSVTVDPTGKFAYVANYNLSSISGYTIDSTTGALTAIAGSPFTSGTNPQSVTVDPTGKFAYVANSSQNNVSGYTINSATGVLTLIAGSPFPAGSTPDSVTVDPTGKFAYTSNLGSGNVSGYAINSSTGALTTLAGSPFPAGNLSFGIATTPGLSAAPTISKSFTPSSIPVGGTSTLMFTIMNPNSSTTLTGIGFSDSLPAGVTGTAAGTGATGPACGGTFTETSTSIVLTGGTLGFGASCNFSVTVTGSTAGSKANTTSAVTSNEGGSGNMAMATLMVMMVAPPSISKSFTPSSIPLGGTSTLMFTIMNPNSSGTLTGIGFSDPLPAGVTGTAATGTACGGTFTATSISVVLMGGMLASGGSCNFSVTVTGSTAGTKSNTTSAVTSNEGGNGNMAMDTLTVSAPPTLTKSFADSQLEFLFGSTALSFTIANPAGNPAPLTNISFSDPLPAGLIVSPLGSGPTGTCVGNGTITAVPGASTVSLSGATLAPGASCTFSVLVNGSQIGVQTNTTSTVTAGPGTLIGSPATAIISVVNTEFLWFFTESGGGGAH